MREVSHDIDRLVFVDAADARGVVQVDLFHRAVPYREQHITIPEGELGFRLSDAQLRQREFLLTLLAVAFAFACAGPTCRLPRGVPGGLGVVTMPSVRA